MELGFALSSEDHPPNELVKQAQIAERAGFTVALPAPRDFEEAAGNVTVADVASLTPTGPDPGPYLELIQKCEKAGFTHLYIHQIGDNQADFAEFARRELMDRL